jgi:hypothetical protein
MQRWRGGGALEGSDRSSRRFFLTGAVVAGASALGACTPKPSFIYESLPVASPPARMQRLLLWLPPSDYPLDGTKVAAEFVKALAPYGVAVETGRSTKLELDRTADQKAITETFRPTYRLEMDIVDASSATSGNISVTAFVLRGVLYRGGSRAPLARFYLQGRDRQAPRLAEEVVANLKAGRYL